MVRVLILAYLGWCGFLYFTQESVLFPTSMTRRSGAGALPRNTERIWLDAADGVRVEAWFIKPSTPAPAGGWPAAIFFHGNAETIDDYVGHADLYLRLGFAVLLPEYRGYGRSGGSPSQSAIGADMVRFYDLLSARPDVDRTRIVFHGQSLGGGVACDLASKRAPAALVLESTFTSVASMCWSYGVPPLLCRNPFHSDDVVRGLDAPILIMHGTEDDIVPVSHGRRLRDLARRGTYVEMPGHHNDFPSDWVKYQKAIADIAGPIATGPPSSSPASPR